jgi:hypothetical protein
MLCAAYVAWKREIIAAHISDSAYAVAKGGLHTGSAGHVSMRPGGRAV